LVRSEYVASENRSFSLVQAAVMCIQGSALHGAFYEVISGVGGVGSGAWAGSTYNLWKPDRDLQRSHPCLFAQRISRVQSLNQGGNYVQV
jgi:hypothetical protein